ncbi:MAG TPA: hypothetical protein VEU77_06630 [Candidatus Acidoferrales bacterium]|nr:hypothetical protein [Candidatus Acidoferrales bacterium]
MARSSALARIPLVGEAHAPAGAIVNLVLRLAIVAMSVDAIVNATDERFAGKALAPRDVLISLGLAMVFPLFWRLRYRGRQWREYPWWFDCLYLSIFVFDMAGNSLGLYNSFTVTFNDITHTYGNGALTIVLAGAFGFTALEAMGLTTILHLILQVEEYYGDVFLHTHNIVGMEGEYQQFVGGLIAVTICGLAWYLSRDWRTKRAKRLRKPKDR